MKQSLQNSVVIDSRSSCMVGLAELCYLSPSLLPLEHHPVVNDRCELSIALLVFTKLHSHHSQNL